MPTGFTIAIPTHDRRETVLLAARSALAQTRAPEQVIVLCDGCTDGSVEALRALGDERLEVLDLPKLPAYGYAHRNTALEHARGEVIAYLADDDLLLPDHLERLGEYWDAGDADLVSSPAVIVHPDDALDWIGEDWGVEHFREAMAAMNTNVMASVSVRADFAREIGGWDASLPRWADWNLWWRCLESGARAWTAAEPTVLHFRATGRDQPWDERVLQNTRWAERIADPDELREVRRLLRRTRSERDERRLREAAALSAALEAQRSACAAAEQRAAAGSAQLDAERADRTALTGEVEGLRAENAVLERDREALRADRDDARALLERIYAGGWWRLRARLLPALERVRRARSPRR